MVNLANKKAISVQDPWFTYILLCKDNCFYVGITNNLSKRVKKHNLGKGSKYIVPSKRPAKLVYSEKHPTKSEARKREIQLKKWTKKKKILLVEGKL